MDTDIFWQLQLRTESKQLVILFALLLRFLIPFLSVCSSPFVMYWLSCSFEIFKIMIEICSLIIIFKSMKSWFLTLVGFCLVHLSKRAFSANLSVPKVWGGERTKPHFYSWWSMVCVLLCMHRSWLEPLFASCTVRMIFQFVLVLFEQVGGNKRENRESTHT